MDNPKADEVKQWLIKSQRNLQSARVLLCSEQSLLDAAVYHCQQAAEKALKGYLMFQDAALQKTHDLEVLINLYAAYEPRFRELEPVAYVLTTYATEFRYPGDVMEPERFEAEEAVEMASSVLSFAVGLMPDDVAM